VLSGESDVRAWIKAHAIPAEPAAGRRKDAGRGTGWWPMHRARRPAGTRLGAVAAMSLPAPPCPPP